ncbi:MAG: hypothetical protein AAGJ37_17250 [Pseudomonadota bacterium]
MRYITLCCIALLATSCFQFSATAQPNDNEIKQPSSQSVNFFKRQVSASQSVENAVKSLISRFPEKTADFVRTALVAYPNKYQEIISASVSAQPAYVDDIIRVATNYKVASPSEIVKIAVSAEPSYAEIATSAACEYSPDRFTEIVKSAVKSEPDSADQIAQKLVTAYPNKTMEILVTTVKEVPFVGKYILDALLAVVQEDDAKSEEMIVMSVEQLAQYPGAIDRLVQLAYEHNIEQEKIKQSAMRGGLSNDEVELVMQPYYTQN